MSTEFVDNFGVCQSGSAQHKEEGPAEVQQGLVLDDASLRE